MRTFARPFLILCLLGSAQTATGWDPEALFDEAAELVESQFYDPAMNGLDWQAVTAEHRARIRPDMSREEFAAGVNDMLDRLGASHTALFTRDSPDWYQLAGIFVDGYAPLRDSLDKHLANGAPVYSGIGFMLEAGQDGHFVTGVLDGFPADTAGVRVGDRLVSVEDAPFHPIRSFSGRDGLVTRLTVERRSGELMDLTVIPALLDGRMMFQDAMRSSARILQHDDLEIGYIRAWSYAGQVYQDILVEELSNGVLKDAVALVLDLRGGWGGASPQYLNFFVEGGIEAHSIGRGGETHRFISGWSRPVVLLVDGKSRSGKELFTYGFKKLGKGLVVGETTAGAVLAGKINALSDGSLLFVAVTDVIVDGERLEGVGVPPDIAVPFDPVYAAGADPQLERALSSAAEQVQGLTNPSSATSAGNCWRGSMPRP
ncbi:MAG: S41 family peptidase [Wenzhouxiangella sp.]